MRCVCIPFHPPQCINTLPCLAPYPGDQDAYIRTHKLEAKWLSVKKDNVYYGWTVNVSSSYNGRAFNYSFAVGMLYGLSKKLVHHIATSAVARKEKVCVCVERGGGCWCLY